MKRITKKLMAAFLAVVMTLSLGVGAFATQDATVTGRSTKDANALVDDPNKAGIVAASQTQEGVAHFEGVDPDMLIRVVLPTTNSYVLNMILDPNGLITATDGAAYNNYTFKKDTNLYFKNVVQSAGSLRRVIPLSDGNGGFDMVNAVRYSRDEVREVTLTETWTDIYVKSAPASSAVSRESSVVTAIGDSVPATLEPVLYVDLATNNVYLPDSNVSAGQGNVATYKATGATGMTNLLSHLADYDYVADDTLVTVAYDSNNTSNAAAGGSANADTVVPNVTKYTLQEYKAYADSNTPYSGVATNKIATKRDLDYAVNNASGVLHDFELIGEKTIDSSEAGNALAAGDVVSIYRKYSYESASDNLHASPTNGLSDTTFFASGQLYRDNDNGFVPSDGDANATLGDATSAAATGTSYTATQVWVKSAGTTEIFWVANSDGTTGKFYKEAGNYANPNDTLAKYVEYTDPYNATWDGTLATPAWVPATYTKVADAAAFKTYDGTYFQTMEADQVSYSGTSDKMTIINKSNRDLGVNLDVVVNKSSTNMNDTAINNAQEREFVFVDSKDKLTDVEKPSMYLALVCGDNEIAVADPDMNDDGVAYVQFPKMKVVSNNKIIKSVVTAFDTSLEETVRGDDVDAAAAAETLKQSFNTQMNGKTIKATYTPATTGENAAPASFNLDLPTLTGFTLTPESENLEIPDEEPDTFAMVVTAASTGSDSATIGTITVNFNYDVVAKLAKKGAALTGTDDYVSFTQWAPRSTASMKRSIAQYSDAFKTVLLNNVNNVNQTQTKKYVYQLKDMYLGHDKDSDFESITFQMTGDISKTTAKAEWPELNDFGVNLVYDVHVFDADYDEPLPEAAGPSVKVTAAGSATGDVVELSYSLGAGTEKAKEFVALYYFKNATATSPQKITTKNIDTTNMVITFASTSDTIKSEAHDFYALFKSKTGEEIKVTFDPKTVTTAG